MSRRSYFCSRILGWASWGAIATAWAVPPSMTTGPGARFLPPPVSNQRIKFRGGPPSAPPAPPAPSLMSAGSAWVERPALTEDTVLLQNTRTVAPPGAGSSADNQIVFGEKGAVDNRDLVKHQRVEPTESSVASDRVGGLTAPQYLRRYLQMLDSREYREIMKNWGDENTLSSMGKFAALMQQFQLKPWGGAASSQGEADNIRRWMEFNGPFRREPDRNFFTHADDWLAGRRAAAETLLNLKKNSVTTDPLEIARSIDAQQRSFDAQFALGSDFPFAWDSTDEKWVSTVGSPSPSMSFAGGTDPGAARATTDEVRKAPAPKPTDAPKTKNPFACDVPTTLKPLYTRPLKPWEEKAYQSLLNSKPEDRRRSPTGDVNIWSSVLTPPVPEPAKGPIVLKNILHY